MCPVKQRKNEIKTVLHLHENFRSSKFKNIFMQNYNSKHGSAL